jgi:hypothetical protein
MVKNLGLGFMVQFLELLKLWIIRVFEKKNVRIYGER